VTDAEREFTEFRAELESAYDTMEKEKNESALALQSYMKAATESKDTLNQAWQSQHTKLGQEHQTLKSEKEAAENTALQRKAELEVSHKSSEERAIRYESEKGALKTRLQEAEDGKRKLTDDLAETQAGLSAARLTIETKEREKETARIKSERRVSELAQEISNLKKASADLVQQQQLDKTSREGLERRLESYQAWDALSPGRLLKQDPLKSRRR
jgi:chromosome segregation ATPase